MGLSKGRRGLRTSKARGFLGAIALSLITALTGPVFRGEAQTLPLPENLLPLNSDRGALLLRQSKAQADFVPLSSQFVTQDNQAFCGVASLAMVLNALGIDAPDAAAWDQDYFTQENVLNSQTEAIIARSLIARQGLTLAELAGIFATYPVTAEIHYGGEIGVDEFRALAIANLQDPQNFMVINYLRAAIGQERGGHISPLAAYSAASDRFLILDVSRYKYPPVWVKTTELWQAMNTLDRTSGKNRGFLVLQKQ